MTETASLQALADQIALTDLSARYASAVDRRDRDEFLALFAPDARLRMYDPADADTPVTDRQGHDQLAVIPEAIQRFTATFHHIGSAIYAVDGDEAEGEVCCVAHHLDDGHDLVMYIRYEDRYRRTGEQWVIVDRTLRVQWVDERAIVRPSS